MDERVNSVDDLSKSGRNFMSFGPVIREITRLDDCVQQASICE